MNCISPIPVQKGVFVPCGVCALCLQDRRDAWTFRIWQTFLRAKTAHFLTFTYADESLCYDVHSRLASVVPDHLTLAIKRLRYYSDCLWRAEKISPPKIKYYACGEYGGELFRPHYHALMFNVHNNIQDKIQFVWPQGHVDFGNVEIASIHYVTGHQIQRYRIYEGRVQPFARMSKGIGAEYVDSNKWWHKGDGEYRNHVMFNGYRRQMPRYLKEKIFTRHERELIGMMNSEEALKAYWEEIERLTLAEVHPDPMSYVLERVEHKNKVLGERQRKGGKGKTIKL